MRWTSPTGDVRCTVTVDVHVTVTVHFTGTDLLPWQQLEGWHCHRSFISRGLHRGILFEGHCCGTISKSACT